MAASFPAADLVLALDSTGPRASAALVTAGGGGRPESLALAVSPPRRRAGQALHGILGEVLRAAGVAARDLGVVVAVRGPGSFTGIRVGLAAAEGLSLATGAPAAGLTVPRVLAAAAGVEGAVRVVLESGFGRVFVTDVVVDEAGRPPAAEIRDAAPDEALVGAPEGERVTLLVRGRPHGIDDLLARGAVTWDEPLAEPAAALALLLGRGGLEPLEPAYGRPPAIRPSRAQGP